MRKVVLPKESLSAWIESMSQSQILMAPVQIGKNSYKFDRVSRLEDISLQYIPTILPPKKYFLPPEEVLMEYDVSDGQNVKAAIYEENKILFGVHTCDLAGVQALNLVFTEGPKDKHFLARKNFFTVIGLECADYCDSYAMCALMKNQLPKGGYDLFMTELSDVYYVDVNTMKGEELVQSFPDFIDVSDDHVNALEKYREQKKQVFRAEVPIRYQDLPRLMAESFNSSVWDDLAERCLSCGNCTNVCPTCYCYDVIDEPDLNLTSGIRKRVWDSCQHEPFAKVAGGENFREARSDRQRHRFNRKFRYPGERFGRLFCTGCGRCSRACMAGINLKDTLNQLMDERG